MNKVFIIALSTFKEAFRNKIAYSVIVFATIIILTSAVFGNATLGSREEVIKDFGLFALSFFGSMLSITLGVSLLNKEIKQKTVFNILSKPVTRGQFIIGKFLGLSSTVITLIILMSTFLFALLYFLEEKIDTRIVQSLYFISLEIICVSAIVIFFSTIVVTTTLSGIFTLGTYLAGKSINYVTTYINKEDFPAFVKNLSQITSAIIPDLSIFSVADFISANHQITSANYIYSSLYCLGYTCILLTLSCLIFNKRELS